MNRLYHELAHLWPLLSPVEDYATEAASILGLLHELGILGKGLPRPALLELGAGGGHTLAYLSQFADAVAVDQSPQMLEQCRRLNPEVACVVGDMCSVALDRQFDVVLCHDAIDYLTTEGQLNQVAANAWRHLRPGGVFIVAPTYTADDPVDGQVETDQNRDDRRVLTFTSYLHDPDVNDQTYRMVMVLIVDEAGRIMVHHEEHELGLFSPKCWLKTLSGAGFSSRRVELRASAPPTADGPPEAGSEVPYPVFVGLKPGSVV